MIQELKQEELQNLIEELLDWDALELQIKELEKGDSDQAKQVEVLFPYLMNDATEYFIRLTDCRIHGSWCGDKKGVLSVTFEEAQEAGDRKGLLIQQDNGTVFSIWYRKALEEMHCYQYHRIGHNWRSEPGQERIRRLVNLLCVLHDKCSYLDEWASTETEREISLLMEFQPLCYWTPIDKSIEEWYPESLDGIYAMENLAEEAGDIPFLELLKQYRIFWENFDDTLSGKRMQKQLFKLREKQSLLQNALIAQEHTGILDLLEKKLEEESLHWEPRVYSEAETERMNLLREEKEEEYREKGYSGNYPFMLRTDVGSDENENGGEKAADVEHNAVERVLFVEEHPFMELEWSDYQFRIYEIRMKTDLT